jgi:hypothetical protein
MTSCPTFWYRWSLLVFGGFVISRLRHGQAHLRKNNECVFPGVLTQVNPNAGERGAFPKRVSVPHHAETSSFPISVSIESVKLLCRFEQSLENKVSSTMATIFACRQSGQHIIVAITNHYDYLLCTGRFEEDSHARRR